ncbi:MAG TPA: hypothetical protein VFP72_22660 [Kineosporiaceae bacterium]|nr:hypothetical protein [Kineosporiaceae bacterium]
MRPAYQSFTTTGELLDHLQALAVRTVVVDVEPLIAFWDTDDRTLAQGVARFLAELGSRPGRLQVIVFATNSARDRPVPTRAGAFEVRYLAHAGKPLRTSPYRRLPLPGAVVGDQIATDGILARRLRYAFLHYTHRPPRTPLGPRMMQALGRPFSRFLFSRDIQRPRRITPGR